MRSYNDKPARGSPCPTLLRVLYMAYYLDSSGCLPPTDLIQTMGYSLSAD